MGLGMSLAVGHLHDSGKRQGDISVKQDMQFGGACGSWPSPGMTEGKREGDMGFRGPGGSWQST